MIIPRQLASVRHKYIHQDQFRETESSRVSTQLLAEELKDLIEKLETLLLEQDKMGGIADEHAFLDRRVHEIAHQSFSILRIGPSVEVAADHQRRGIDVRGVPQWSPGCLVEGIF